MFGRNQVDWNNLPKSEKILRKLLWLQHGHTALYGDDGEMQCSECMLDFKRDSSEDIKKVFDEQAKKRMETYF